MKVIFCAVFLMMIVAGAHAQLKSYIIGVKGDTLNKVDEKGLKQARWINHVGELRGEPGYEEEGEYKNDRKEGPWRIYSLTGDLIGSETYKWGNKDGICQYFNRSGELLREESWRALNPDKLYDTLEVEDVDHLDHYHTVIVKNEGAAIKDKTWKFYDPTSGMVIRTVTYELGKLVTPSSAAKDSTATAAAPKSKVKPKEVMDFEKKNSGKKKVKVQDGTVNY